MEHNTSTRTFITNLFSNISQEGLGNSFIDSLSDKVIWTATGSSPLSGRYEGKKAYREQILAKLHERLETSVKPQVDLILVDGDWAAVNFHTTGAKGYNGVDFSMSYCWLMRVENGKVTEVIGFYDQKKMCDLFA